MRTQAQLATPRHWLARKRWAATTAAALVLAVSMAGWAAGKNGKLVAAKPADEAGKTANEAAPAAKADTVHITIQTVPPRKAQVKWGRKNLGVIPVPRPLVVERPRDSGPMDLAIRASGFLPVHTRAYTFTDSRVAVKLTPPTEKNTLFGYREEPAPNPDAGVPGAPTAPVLVPEPPKP
jgi:hypothetical protein